MGYSDILLPLVKKAGDAVKNAYRSDYTEYREKAPADYVTEIDTKIETELRTALKKEFPEYGIIGEEFGTENSEAEYKWVIDPLDGTTNFIHKIPYFCIAVALKKKEEPIFSVIYDPVNGDLFHAEKGKGAFIGEYKLAVRKRPEMHNWFMAFCAPDSTKNEEAERIVFDAFYHSTLRLTKLGSASLEFAYVAAGRLDAYIGIRLKEWDILPGELLVKEAGGTVEFAELIGKKLIIAGHNDNVEKIKGLILPHGYYEGPDIF